MWAILFHFFFGAVWATQDKIITGKRLTWKTREEAEEWARRNCGENLFEAIKIKEGE